MVLCAAAIYSTEIRHCWEIGNYVQKNYRKRITIIHSDCYYIMLTSGQITTGDTLITIIETNQYVAAKTL